MSIIKINQLPVSSGLTPDDLLLVMDNPSNSKITKSISLKNLNESTTFLKTRDITQLYVSRGQYVPADSEYNPPFDSILSFSDSELPFYWYKVECKALFIDAPPIAFINEPAQGRVHGTHKITKFTLDTTVLTKGDNYGFTGINNVLGSAVGQTITSAILPNSNAGVLSSDFYEPKFFYDDDINALGYLVEINFIGSLVRPTAPAVGLRWGSAINTRNTQLVSGYLLLEALI